MKSVKLLIFTAFFFISCLDSLNAQQIWVEGSDIILDKLRLNKGIDGNVNGFYKEVQGDPFIFSDFREATLYVLPDKEYKVSVRYDIYADQIHLKNNDEIYAIIHPDRVELIDAGSYKFIYSKYLKYPGDDEPEQSSYFILKTDGKCSLLIKKNLRVQEAEPPKLYQEAKPAKFIPSGDTYFLKLEGMSAVRIRNKKDLLNILSGKSDALESYISSNKLNAKDIDDLVKIVTYFNTL